MQRPQVNSKIVFFFFFLFFVFKLLYLYFLDLPLSYDEAYYWDWSRFLDFGYYNKPPMIAWIIRASTEILGTSEFAIRLPALCLSTLAIFFSYLLTTEHLNKANASILLLSLLFLPILTVYSFVMTIDPPLIFFWILSLYFFLEYLKTTNYRNASLTGMFIGFGLLTKQTMLAFLVLSISYLILFRKDLIFKKQTYLLFLISFLVYFPNIYWNYSHQFVLFKHTEEHFSRKVFSLFSFLKFLGDSIGVYTPLFLFFVYFGIRYTKDLFKKHFSDSLSFLYFLSFPLILTLLFLSFFIKLNVNWILPFMLTGFMFFFGYVSFSRKWKVLIFSNLIISIILSLLIFPLGYFSEKFPEPFQILLEKFKGWKFLAERVEKWYNGETPLLTESRDIAASLAFYIKDHPKVYVIKPKGFPENQYHLWRKTEILRGKKILVVKKGLEMPYYLKKGEKLEDVVIKVTKKRYRYFSIWKGILNL